MATATATTLATTTAMDSPTDTATDTPTSATPLWLLPLTPCPPSTEVLCTDSPRSMAVSTATTMARGPLMPSPLLLLLLKPMPMPTTTTGMPTTATVSTMATLLPTMD